MTTSSVLYFAPILLHRWRSWAVYLLLFLTGVTAKATTVVPPKFVELVNESDYIVRGLVKAVKSDWREKNGQRYIITEVEVEVLEVINGTPPQPLVLKLLGGRVAGDEMAIEGMPKFAVGQEDILFVRGNGRQFFPLTAAMHGRYPVVRETNGRAHIMRSDRTPLHDTTEVELPMAEGNTAELPQQASESTQGISPDNFVQQIRATVNANYQHASDRGN